MLSSDMALFALNNTPIEVFWLDTDGRVVEVNAAAHEALGYAREDLIGLRVTDFAPGYDRDRWRVLLDVLRRDGKAFRETFHRREDGTEYPVEVTISLFQKDGADLVCGMVRDVSDRKRLEGRSAEYLARYRDAINTSALGFWAVDLTGHILDANATYARLSGYDRDSLIGMRIADFEADQDGDVIRTLAARAVLEESAHFRSRHRRVDGTIWPVEIAINYSSVNGGTFFVFILDVTDQVAKERELAAKSAQLETLLVRYREAQAIAKLGHYVYDIVRDRWDGSEVLNGIFGIDTAHDRTAQGWVKVIHPEDRAEMEAYLRDHVIGQGKDFDKLYRIIDQTTGAVKLLHGKGLLRRDNRGNPLELFGAIQDVTDLKRLEGAVRASELLKRQILDTIPDLVWLKDVEGRYMACNPVFERLYGAKEADLLGKDDFAFVDRETAAFFRHNDRQAIAAGRSLMNEEWLTFADDGHRALHETIKTPLKDEEGRIIGVLGLARDITDRKRIEEALRKTNEELRRSNADLESFAYVASHDLREPLRTVASFTTLLERSLGEGLAPEQAEYLHFVHDGATRMDRLIRDLLEYSRVGRTSAPREDLSLERVIGAVLGHLKAGVAEAEARVEITCHGAKVHASREEVERLFLNVIGNALKYRSPDRRPEISVGCTRRGAQWEFSVRDNGIGIDMKQHFYDRIFRLFQRLHGRDDYGGGTGVGLSICKKIVESHGGRIWVESTLGEGSTFFFTLPATGGPSVAQTPPEGG
ncbi:MAG: PAS domain S-box protein, partial [Rhodospirillum sp.]|nr:PAS domain S-box protein [Rhodospirillum sp.]